MRVLLQQCCRVLRWREAVGADDQQQSTALYESIARYDSFDERNQQTRITCIDRSEVNDKSPRRSGVRAVEHPPHECSDGLAFTTHLRERYVDRAGGTIDRVRIGLALCDDRWHCRPWRRSRRLSTSQDHQDESKLKSAHVRSHGNGRGRGHGHGQGSNEFLPASPRTAASRTLGSLEVRS